MRSGLLSGLLFTQIQQLVKLGTRNWWVSALLWIAMLNPALAVELELRVAIEEDADRVQVGSSTNAVVKNSAGQTLGELPGMDGFAAQPTAGGIALSQWRASQIWIEPTGDGYVWIGDRWYRGRVLLVPTEDGLTAVNYVDLEHYLYSVVGGEMPPSWPMEALKAQAVAARSYALYHREKTADRFYDLGDTTAWQVYRGIEDEYVSTQRAVDETAGQALVHEGKIIQAVFHSSSGGHTENVEDIWLQPLPYLRGVPDFDFQAPVFEWTKIVSADQIKSAIADVGNILSMVPERTTPHGRIVSMNVVGDKGEKVMTGKQLRKVLDLRSTLFTVHPQPDSADKANSTPVSFTINGRGFGHGLGMSQYGANGLARRGYNYQHILQHYYTDTSLARIELESDS